MGLLTALDMICGIIGNRCIKNLKMDKNFMFTIMLRPIKKFSALIVDKFF